MNFLSFFCIFLELSFIDKTKFQGFSCFFLCFWFLCRVLQLKCWSEKSYQLDKKILKKKHSICTPKSEKIKQEWKYSIAENDMKRKCENIIVIFSYNNSIYEENMEITKNAKKSDRFSAVRLILTSSISVFWSVTTLRHFWSHVLQISNSIKNCYFFSRFHSV